MLVTLKKIFLQSKRKHSWTNLIGKQCLNCNFLRLHYTSDLNCEIIYIPCKKSVKLICSNFKFAWSADNFKLRI